jgi:glycosyltransferase involved in cell wall biosynthesis
MARFWCAAGHQVSVVAGTVSLSTGRTHPGMRGLVTRTSDGPVTVWRAHVPSTYSKSYLGRRLAYAVFTFSACVAALRSGPTDVIIATSPPLVVVIAGWLAAKVRRVPWLFEVRDIWPESAVSTGVVSARAPLTRFFYWLERASCRSAIRVVALTDAIADDIERRGLAPRSRLVVIPNAADLRLFAPGPRDNSFRREFGWGERIVAMYTGAHGRANALGQILDAAEELRDRSDIVIAFVGDGQQRRALESDARRRGLANVVFCGPQPKERMPECVNAADVCLAVLQRNATFRTVYPNKLFDYMACARPIVVGIDGAARKLVTEEARAGLYAEPEDGPALARAIRTLADDPELRRRLGESGRNWVETHASRERVAADYIAMLQDLTRRP